MKPYEVVGLYVYPNEGENNENLQVFITEPGEEYFVHLFFWRINPFSFTLDAKEEMVDITLKKVVEYHYDDCNESDDYNYIGKQYVENLVPIRDRGIKLHPS